MTVGEKIVYSLIASFPPRRRRGCSGENAIHIYIYAPRVYIIYLRISQVVYAHTSTPTHTHTPIMYTEGCNKALKKKNGDGRPSGGRKYGGGARARARAVRKMKLRGKDAYSTQRR